MEKQVKIRTPDKKVIHGVLNWKRKTDKLIIFVHGLTGNLNEHHFHNAARFFPAKGYATFRFNLYSGEKGARRFTETTISTHSHDVDTVVRHFSRQYKRIYLVGHSLGGPAVLLSRLEHAKAIVLWDPSENIKSRMDSWCRYNKQLNAYIIDWGTEMIMSNEYHESLIGLPSMLPIVKNMKIPTRIITAGNGDLQRLWKGMGNTVKIPKATHTFDEEGTEEKLFKETLSWIRKF